MNQFDVTKMTIQDPQGMTLAYLTKVENGECVGPMPSHLDRWVQATGGDVSVLGRWRSPEGDFTVTCSATEVLVEAHALSLAEDAWPRGRGMLDFLRGVDDSRDPLGSVAALIVSAIIEFHASRSDPREFVAGDCFAFVNDSYCYPGDVIYGEICSELITEQEHPEVGGDDWYPVRAWYPGEGWNYDVYQPFLTNVKISRRQLELAMQDTEPTHVRLAEILEEHADI